MRLPPLFLLILLIVPHDTTPQPSSWCTSVTITYDGGDTLLHHDDVLTSYELSTSTDCGNPNKPVYESTTSDLTIFWDISGVYEWVIGPNICDTDSTIIWDGDGFLPHQSSTESWGCYDEGNDAIMCTGLNIVCVVNPDNDNDDPDDNDDDVSAPSFIPIPNFFNSNELDRITALDFDNNRFATVIEEGNGNTHMGIAFLDQYTFLSSSSKTGEILKYVGRASEASEAVRTYTRRGSHTADSNCTLCDRRTSRRRVAYRSEAFVCVESEACRYCSFS